MIKLHLKADPRVTMEVPNEIFYMGDAVPDIYSVVYWEDDFRRELVLFRRDWVIDYATH